MPPASRFVTLEGEFEERVLGIFRIIRGFANLKDLAEISVPYQMENAATAGRVHGHQRAVDPDHSAQIQQYLEKGNARFLPEVILSVRTQLTDVTDAGTVIGVESQGSNGIHIRRRWSSKKVRTHQLRIERSQIQQSIQAERRIRRIDGNHRLDRAQHLADDPQEPRKYLASFCLVLLKPPGDDTDDYYESLIFHTINSTALPLDSEHAISLILGQNPSHRMTADEEYASNPTLYLTRLLKERIDNLPAPQKSRLGTRPASVLHGAARAMIAKDSSVAATRPVLEQFAEAFVGALNEILSRIPASSPVLVSSELFIELASCAWQESGDGGHDARLNKTVATLEELARWLGKEGLINLRPHQSLAEQLFGIFRTVRARVPKRIFMARWYPIDTDAGELTKANLRLDMIKRALDDLRKDGIDLALDDPGTKTGSTFPIHQEMYRALAENDIILIDLSGVRPNVCVEAGYALQHHAKGRLLFLFQPTGVTPNNSAFSNPPFDLNTFRYEKVADAAEIPDKIKPNLRACPKWMDVTAGAAGP